jgi:hypothetical protein
MSKGSKIISGLKSKKGRNKTIHFSEKKKRKIIEDYLTSGSSKRIIWYKYTGRDEEHGAILRWMRELGYIDNVGEKVNFVKKTMPKKKIIVTPVSELEFENLQLKKRIDQLEHQVRDTEMKALAFSTMVDIAEREYNISIRKKYITKPSKN